MLSTCLKRPAVVAAGMLALLLSCEAEKKEPFLAEEGPEVTLEVSGNPAKLYNEVTLSAAATDNDAVERVVFFINSDSIGEAVEDPYELKWDTKEVEDGPYMLKAVAYDKTGNKGEAVLEGSVKNVLLVVEVESGYLQARENLTEKEWIFLSDKKGQLIGKPKELVNGTRLSWERPSDFYADTFYLNELYYIRRSFEWQKKSTESLSLRTYTDFTLDEAVFMATNYKDSLGKADIRIENDFDRHEEYTYRLAFPYNSVSTTKAAGTVRFTVSMFENLQQAFSTYEKKVEADQSQRKKYYRMDELETGNSYFFHTSDYAPMDVQEISFSFDFSQAGVSISGYLNKDQQRGYELDNTSISKNQGQEIKAFSANVFPYINTYISGRTGNKFFYLSTLDLAPAIYSLPEFSANVQSTDMKNIKVTTNGAFDVGNGFWQYTEESESLYLTVKRGFYFSSESGASYVLPKVPASLLERFPALNKPMEFSWSWASERQALNSYDGVLRNWFTNDDNSLEYLEYSGIYIYSESAGGRLLPRREAKFPQEKSEQEYLRERGLLGY